jgi:hypothetical protein
MPGEARSESTETMIAEYERRENARINSVSRQACDKVNRVSWEVLAEMEHRVFDVIEWMCSRFDSPCPPPPPMMVCLLRDKPVVV